MFLKRYFGKVVPFFSFTNKLRYSSNVDGNFDFNSVSESFLNGLLENLETKENVEQLPSSFDAEYTQGVLTIKYDPQTVYVVNKQPPNQQIWLSSPFSGPKRFEWNYQTGSWCDVRNSTIELGHFLKTEFSEKLKLNLRFDDSNTKTNK